MFDSRDELQGKVEWEGGVSEAIFSYGLTADDLPPGTPWEVVKAWRMLEAAREAEEIISVWLYAAK
jgi:hypothetical protein